MDNRTTNQEHFKWWWIWIGYFPCDAGLDDQPAQTTKSIDNTMTNQKPLSLRWTNIGHFTVVGDIFTTKNSHY